MTFLVLFFAHFTLLLTTSKALQSLKSFQCSSLVLTHKAKSSFWRSLQQQQIMLHVQTQFSKQSFFQAKSVDYNEAREAHCMSASLHLLLACQYSLRFLVVFSLVHFHHYSLNSVDGLSYLGTTYVGGYRTSMKIVTDVLKFPWPFQARMVQLPRSRRLACRILMKGPSV